MKALIAKLAHSGQPATHVHYSGVMHYGSNEVNGRYERTPKCDVNNRQYVQTLLARSKAQGLPGVTLHSEVGADEDLCTLAYSPRVLIHGTATRAFQTLCSSCAGAPNNQRRPRTRKTDW